MPLSPCPGVSLGQVLITTALITALPTLDSGWAPEAGSPQPSTLPKHPTDKAATQRQYAIVNMQEAAQKAWWVNRLEHTWKFLKLSKNLLEVVIGCVAILAPPIPSSWGKKERSN